MDLSVSPDAATRIGVSTSRCVMKTASRIQTALSPLSVALKVSAHMKLYAKAISRQVMSALITVNASHSTAIKMCAQLNKQLAQYGS
jgi:hypothetical protein